MILTDGTHLVSTFSRNELHAFAERIGLRREWFQEHRIAHYDLLGQPALRRALQAGAVMKSRRELVRAWRAARCRVCGGTQDVGVKR